jgi:hypothetical protein
MNNRISKAIPWNASTKFIETSIKEITDNSVKVCVSRSITRQSEGGYQWAIRFDSLISVDSLEVEAAQFREQDRAMVLNVTHLHIGRPLSTWIVESGDDYMCTSRYATYRSGSGTSLLTFSYLVLPGDFSDSLNVATSSSIIYTSIHDRICNFINKVGFCSIPVNSSLYNKSTVDQIGTSIDTSVPYVLNILLADGYEPNRTYAGGDSITVNVLFSQPVVVSFELLHFST